MPEGLSAAEVGKEIAEHREEASAHHAEGPAHHVRRDRWISISEAVLLSLVALLAAWSGYSAAKWGTASSISLANASSAQTQGNLKASEALQIRTLDSVSFNAAETAYAANNAKLFRLTVRRLRPGYRPAFDAWLATHPLKNPHAPPDPSFMPQYRIPEQAQAQVLSAQVRCRFQQRPVSRGNGRQVRAPHGLPGRRAVPRRHQQPFPGPLRALRPHRDCCRAVGLVGGAAPRPSGPTSLTGMLLRCRASPPGGRSRRVLIRAYLWGPGRVAGVVLTG